jgi:hypothetical protein
MPQLHRSLRIPLQLADERISRKEQLKRILADIDRQIAEAESAMLNPQSDDESRLLIDTQADLHMSRSEVVNLLKDAEITS